MVGGRKNPGILNVDKKFVYICNSVNKEGNVFRYICQHRLTPGVKCIAKATVRATSGRGQLLGPALKSKMATMCVVCSV